MLKQKGKKQPTLVKKPVVVRELTPVPDEQQQHENETIVTDDPILDNASKEEEEKEKNDDVVKSKKTSRSVKAGLFFPVGRTQSRMRESQKMRVGETAAVYLTAVLQYLAAELVETSYEMAHLKSKKIIMPDHLKAVFNLDESFYDLGNASGITLSNTRVFNASSTLILLKRKQKREERQRSTQKKKAKSSNDSK